MRFSTVLLTLLATTVNGIVLRDPDVQVQQQQPFELLSKKERYHVRRFHTPSREERLETIRLAQRYSIDLWGVGDDFADLYFGDPIAATALHGDFAQRNFTTRVIEWEYPTTLSRSSVQVHELTTPDDDQAACIDRKRTANKIKNRKKDRKEREKERKKRPRPYPHPNTSPWDVTTVSNCTFHEEFRTQAEIHDFVHQLAEQHPDVVDLIELGRSSEGRHLLALNIAVPGRRKHRKARMVIQGAQHAREWIATSTALYLAHSLIVDKSDPMSKKSILDYLDITVIPLPNPDGYLYTWEHNRLWYKNRSPVGEGKCHGIDLNRNWGYEWEQGDETDPCSSWYPGSHAFQAPEVSAIASFINRTPNIEAFIDLRSFGQLVMHPYSYSCDAVAPDAENLIEAALGAAQALSKRHGTKMETGRICDKLYEAPGNIADWMYGDAGIMLTYSVMLRDTGTYGYLLPPTWIRPVGEEVADMVQYLQRWMKLHKI